MTERPPPGPADLTTRPARSARASRCEMAPAVTSVRWAISLRRELVRRPGPAQHAEQVALAGPSRPWFASPERRSSAISRRPPSRVQLDRHRVPSRSGAGGVVCDAADTGPGGRRSAVTWDPSSMSWSTTRAATPTWTRPARRAGTARPATSRPATSRPATPRPATSRRWPPAGGPTSTRTCSARCAELGPRGITANVISAGYIAGTNFFRAALTSERRESLIAATHDKRPGRPDDIAATAYFLASPGARHISGQTIHVNGGAFTTR